MVDRTALCPECGSEFILPGKRLKKYCNDKCTARAKSARYRASDKGKLAVSAYQSSDRAREIGRSSSARYRASEKGQVDYVTRRDSGGYAAASKRSRRRRVQNTTHVCKYCLQEFTVRGNHRRVTCGSDGCKKLAMRDVVNRRIALRKKATIEVFTHLEIFERDRWVCGLCGKKVDNRLKYPNPLSAALDHVVPLSRGGDHSRANTQLAHFACNSVKGARGGGEQLALM